MKAGRPFMSIGEVLGALQPDFPPALLVVCVVGLLDAFERHPFVGIIARPDLVGALEGHVLEHVSQAGDPWVFAVGAHVHVSEERENRRFVPLANQHRQPVVQDLDRHAFFEGGDVLRWRQRRARGQHPDGQKDSRPATGSSTSEITD